jgi:hypothetical protein
MIRANWAQVEQPLLCKYEDLSSNPRPTHTPKKLDFREITNISLVCVCFKYCMDHTYSSLTEI